MPVKDLPILGRHDSDWDREIGSRELYYGIERALRMDEPRALFLYLRKVKKLFPEYAHVYAELIKTWLAGEWVG